MSRFHRIRVNVAGRVFETTTDTLRSVPGSYFSARLENFSEGTIENSMATPIELYLDEDPEAFTFALEYLRFRRRGGHFDVRVIPSHLLPRLRSLAQYLLLDELDEECEKALGEALEKVGGVRPESALHRPDPLKEHFQELFRLLGLIDYNREVVFWALAEHRVYGPTTGPQNLAITPEDWALLCTAAGNRTDIEVYKSSGTFHAKHRSTMIDRTGVEVKVWARDSATGGNFAVIPQYDPLSSLIRSPLHPRVEPLGLYLSSMGLDWDQTYGSEEDDEEEEEDDDFPDKSLSGYLPTVNNHLRRILTEVRRWWEWRRDNLVQDLEWGAVKGDRYSFPGTARAFLVHPKRYDVDPATGALTLRSNAADFAKPPEWREDVGEGVFKVPEGTSAVDRSLSWEAQ